MPNELPLNWCECKFEDFVQILDGNRKPVNSTERELRISKAKKLYPYYGATGQVGYIDDYLLDGNFVLLGEDGAPFLEPFKNKAYIVSGKIWVNNHAHILKGYSNISDKFIYYWLNSISYKDYVSGTTRLKLNQAMMKDIICHLPPLAEQERIVEKIETLFADIDEGVERLKSAQAQIKQYRQSVLKSAFEGKLYKITEWKKSTLEQYIQEINYGTSEKTKDFGKIPVFRMGDIQEGKLTFNNFKYLDKINDEKLILKKGDLLFNRTNSAELVGKSAVFNHEGSYSFASYIIKVRFDTSLDSNFICYYINSPKGRNWAKTQISQQVGQANINGTKLKNLPFPLPTLSEQQRIVEEIEKRFAVADELEKAVNDGLEKAEKLKQSILKKAFVGKLVPQDPNDEPASILLERIKKETQSPAKGRKK